MWKKRTNEAEVIILTITFQYSFFFPQQKYLNGNNSCFLIRKHSAFLDRAASANISKNIWDISMQTIFQKNKFLKCSSCSRFFFSIEGSFLPNVLFKVVWKVNTLIIFCSSYICYSFSLLLLLKVFKRSGFSQLVKKKHNLFQSSLDERKLNN